VFRILFVCTGNRCRSPLAEVHLRRLTQGLPIDVASVGLLDLGSVPVPQEMLEVAQSSGLDLSSHRSRALASVDVSRVDLVIGLERSHVATAVVEGNVPYDRAFSLKEIVRLLAEVEVPEAADEEERARLAVARAHELRARGPSFVPGEDVADPFGGPRRGYYEMADELAALCRSLVAGLLGNGRVSPQAPTRRR
jgi:protein-tyrosine phosphatase